MGTFESDPLLINTDNNYAYDELGQLIKDEQEAISEIRWRNDGKISTIIRNSGSGEEMLQFAYNPNGERISKKVFDDNGSWLETTYYIRDASGNVMSTYLNKNASFDLTERFIYGSSRLGVYKEPISMLGTAPTDLTYVRPGYKQYELTNHTSAPLSAGLGNVTAVVTAQKVPIYTGTTIDGYSPQIVKSYDYSPFGVTRIDHNVTARLTGTFAVDGGYRYGFNGMEKDDEVKGAGNSLDFGARVYDSRLGRWFSIDPLAAKYPDKSPYNFTANNPIIYVDFDGRDYEYSTKIIYDKSGKPIQKIVNINVNVKVLNLTDRTLDDRDFSAATVKGGQIFDYNHESMVYDNDKNAVLVPTTVNVSVSFEVVDNLSSVGGADNVMLIVDGIKGGDGGYAGKAEYDGFVSAVQGDFIGKNGWEQLVLHELGHNLRYEDNYVEAEGESGKIVHFGRGLMGALQNSGKGGQPANYSSTPEENQGTGMHQHTGTGTRSSGGDKKTKVRDFVSRATTESSRNPKLK